MKLCTITKGIAMSGNFEHEHFMITEVGSNWPVAVCGLTNGSMASQSEAEAKILADAPVMLDMLEHLTGIFCDLKPGDSVSDKKIDELSVFVERATVLVNKHLGRNQSKR